MAPDDITNLEFEQAFQRLEETVQSLERGGLTLNQALALYEEGMSLAQLCSRHLDGAELRITELQNAFQSNQSAVKEDHGDLYDAP